MKKTVCAVLALVFTMLCFSGCGKQQPIVSMYELSREMLAALNTQETMLYVSGADADAAEKFAHVSDMDYSLVEDFFLLYAENGAGNADEIAVINNGEVAAFSKKDESLPELLKGMEGCRYYQ